MSYFVGTTDDGRELTFSDDWELLADGKLVIEGGTFTIKGVEMKLTSHVDKGMDYDDYGPTENGYDTFYRRFVPVDPVSDAQPINVAISDYTGDGSIFDLNGKCLCSNEEDDC